MFKTLTLLFFILSTAPITTTAQDPMRPPGWALKMKTDSTAKIEPLELQQILKSKNRKVAIINDTLVVEGQAIGSAKVIEIADKSVKVMYKGRRIDLTMTTTAKEYNREK